MKEILGYVHHIRGTTIRAVDMMYIGKDLLKEGWSIWRAYESILRSYPREMIHEEDLNIIILHMKSKREKMNLGRRNIVNTVEKITIKTLKRLGLTIADGLVSIEKQHGLETLNGQELKIWSVQDIVRCVVGRVAFMGIILCHVGSHMMIRGRILLKFAYRIITLSKISLKDS